MTALPIGEIIASLFEAVVYQNLATLTKGHTLMPEALLLGGPNLFSSRMPTSSATSAAATSRS